MAEVAAVEVDQDRTARGATAPPVEVETVAPTRVAVGDVARPPYRSSEEWEREEHDPAPGQAAAVSHVRVEVVTPGCAQLSREGVLHNGARPQAPSDEDGRDREARGPDGGSAGRGVGGSAALPNIISVGTLPLALAGVTTVIWMSTEMAGYDELSTWPTNCFATTGRPATCAFTVCYTSHFTAGTLAGTRPCSAGA